MSLPGPSGSGSPPRRSAGPLPNEYQRVTTFSTGIATDAENPDGRGNGVAVGLDASGGGPGRTWPGWLGRTLQGAPGTCGRPACRRSPWNDGMLFHSSEFMADWRNESDNEGSHSTAPDRTGRIAGPCRQSRCGDCRAWWKAGRREVVDTASEAAAEAAQHVGGSAEGHVRADEEVLGGASEAICCDRERRVCRRGEWGERRVVGSSGSRRHHCCRDAGGDAEDMALQACA